MNSMLADVERRCQEWQNCLTDIYADEVAERRGASFDFFIPGNPLRIPLLT